MPGPSRDRVDRCPGVLDPGRSADGALARVRLPGGAVSAAALQVLAGCARDLGDGNVHLTSRGNVQLRGVAHDEPELPRRLRAAGLLPSPSHERARNVLASPLSGVRGGLADVRRLAARLDRELCGRPALAALPGRFLFALDDGRGDVAGQAPDVCWLATGRDVGTLLVAGTDTGLVVSPTDAPGVLVSAAEAFLAVRAAGGPGAWRAAELPGAAARISARLPGRRVAPRPVPDTRVPLTDLLGPIAGGAVGVAPLLGEVPAGALIVLAGLADDVVVTPWRTVLLPRPRRGALDRLAAVGFVVDAADPAAHVSACAGLPGCASALADVRGDLRAALAAGAVPRGERVHVVACARGCGTPHEPHRRVEAVAAGYAERGGARGSIEAVLSTPAG